MSTLPGGTVTFVFTDIEGSTRLLQELERVFSGDKTTPARAVAGGLAALGVLLAFFIILLVALKLIFF
jgi:hypothetical protein